MHSLRHRERKWRAALGPFLSHMQQVVSWQRCCNFVLWHLSSSMNIWVCTYICIWDLDLGQYLYLCIYLQIYQSTYQSIYLSIHLSTYLSMTIACQLDSVSTKFSQWCLQGDAHTQNVGGAQTSCRPVWCLQRSAESFHMFSRFSVDFLSRAFPRNSSCRKRLWRPQLAPCFTRVRLLSLAAQSSGRVWQPFAPDSTRVCNQCYCHCPLQIMTASMVHGRPRKELWVLCRCLKFLRIWWVKL